MSKHGTYRHFHTVFWASEYVESLDPVEKLLYLYMIFSPLSNMEGVYKTTLRRVAFETGIDKDMVLKITKRLENDNKAGIYIKDNAAWIVVCNAADHVNNWSPNIVKGFQATYTEIPDDVHEYMQSIGYQYPNEAPYKPLTSPLQAPSRGYQAPDHTNTNTNTNTNTGSKADTTHPTTQEPMNYTTYHNLLEEYESSTVEDYFQRVADYCAAKGKSYKDHAATVRNWLKHDEVPKRRKQKAPPIDVGKLGGGAA